MSKNIYYWPGIHRIASELSHVFLWLTQNGYRIDSMGVPFDEPTAPHSMSSKYSYIIEDLSKKKYSTWIGLSYGAALSWHIVNKVPNELLPQNLFLINPFSRRRELSEYKNFTYSDEWDINPEEEKPCLEVNNVLIISQKDTHIPMQFKTGIIENFEKNMLPVYYLECEHAFATQNEQMELYSVLKKELGIKA